MNRVQEQLVQRKIKKATEKNTKTKLLKAIYNRQKKLVEKKQEIERENIIQEDGLMKKKMDFYDSLFKEDKNDTSNTNQNHQNEEQYDTNGVSNNSKGIKKESKSHPMDKFHKPNMGKSFVKKPKTDKKQQKIDRDNEKQAKLEQRKKKYHKLNSKTSKGQPVMKNLMNDLFHKVKQSFKALK